MAASRELVSFKDVMASLEAESPPLEFGATLPENQTRSGLALRDNVQNDVRGSGVVRDTLDAERVPDCASTALDPASRPPTKESPGAVARRVTKIPNTLHGQHHQYHDGLMDANGCAREEAGCIG